MQEVAGIGWCLDIDLHICRSAQQLTAAPCLLCASSQTQLVRGMAEVGEHALAEEYRQQLGLPLDTLAPPDPGETCGTCRCCKHTDAIVCVC